MGIKKSTLLLSALCLCAAVCCNQQKGAFTDKRDGQKYRTVKIGETTWMAENLNFKAENSYCYDDNKSNCATYGRLYTWEAAMSACPRGWHLPTRSEWGGLVYGAGDDGDAGRGLKSKMGWDSDGGEYHSGNDEFGFSALPGGYRDYLDGCFGDAGYRGHFWSATSHGGGKAYGRPMRHDSPHVGESGYDTAYSLSVRCVKDVGSAKAGGASDADAPQPTAADSFFTDARDGRRYRTVGIASQTWMAENLNFKTDSSWCYNNDPDACAKYGRLYDFETALEVCPTGWHLPTETEWNLLVWAAWDKDVAGRKLKSKSGWGASEGGAGESGIDEFGFAALPGGTRGGDVFDGAGHRTCFWSSTIQLGFLTSWTACLSIHGGDYIGRLDPAHDSDGAGLVGPDGGDGNSVRCIRDAGGENAGGASDTAAPIPSPTPQTAAAKPAGKRSSFTDLRDGKVYKTVKIGKDTWMAENLNFREETSLCYNDYESNCVKYGRLYDRYAASSVCPSGWHLPDSAEWHRLLTAAGGKVDVHDNRDYLNAGKKLKSKEGWSTFRGWYDHTRYKDMDGNGTDRLGFSALPGGCHNCQLCTDAECGFTDAGNGGFFWGAINERLGNRSACILTNSTDAFGNSTAEFAYNYHKAGRASLSVRCVMDAGVVSAGAVAAIAPQPAAVDTSFTDLRDGKSYRTVKIGRNTWMAENLNYKTGGSWCYGDNEANCKIYGRLYAWNAAKGACPDGWSLSSENDWDDLIDAAGGVKVAGKKLKSKAGWNERKNTTSGGGTDDIGFEALPGSGRFSANVRGSGGYRKNSGYSGFWWGDRDDDYSFTFYMTMGYNNDMVDFGLSDKTDNAFSVRCVRN